MIGAPGCGKSYYIKQHLKDNEIVISRDAIRFNMLKDTDAYFSKEKQVYNEFIKQINAAIADDRDFYVDQTSLNRGARAKLFSHLERKPNKMIAIYINAPLEKILYQNSLRTGRALVPEDAVINMFNSIEKPTKAEGFDEIWEVE
jgi:predicted kinase